MSGWWRDTSLRGGLKFFKSDQFWCIMQYQVRSVYKWYMALLWFLCYLRRENRIGNGLTLLAHNSSDFCPISVNFCARIRCRCQFSRFLCRCATCFVARLPNKNRREKYFHFHALPGTSAALRIPPTPFHLHSGLCLLFLLSPFFIGIASVHSFFYHDFSL